MIAQSLKLVCFSPTGTTRSVVQAIADGIGRKEVELIDITKPNARKQRLQSSENELLIIAVPVYVGRVPALLGEWLHAIQADRTPTVCVVVYGNREYEDALLELRNIMMERGGRPIACAAFIGEHSYSSSDTPIAVARPDAADLKKAGIFGRKIDETLRSISSVNLVAEIDVPGNYPYRDLGDLFSEDFIDTDDKCLHCGVCSESCPVGAIDDERSSLIDKRRCISCCACIKLCPENAKTMKKGVVKDTAIRVSEMCQERKEPELFF